MTTKLLLKLSLFLFCVVTLLNLIFGRSFSTAISRSLLVCLVVSGWSLGIWLLYSRIADSVRRTVERNAETEVEEGPDDNVSPHR